MYAGPQPSDRRELVTEMKNSTIPIIVGVTGHRDIRDEDRDILLEAVRGELEKLAAACPNSELVMLSSLADGADSLCAEAALSLSVPLIAALPMERDEYEKDFSGEALSRFRALCGAAGDLFAVPAAEPVPEKPDRDFLYRQAGIYVAEHAHVLIALWDGKEGASGCGTAETVQFALERAYLPADGAPPAYGGAVIHIETPRAGGAAEAELKAGNTSFLGDRERFDAVLARTDEFNRLSAAEAQANDPLLPAGHEADACLDRLEAAYSAADTLSLRFSKRYRLLLALLALFGTAITVAFLLYDEAELHWMIILCGVVLAAAFIAQRYGNRLACHRRYIEYRTLAETLRVQAFLRYAGSGVGVLRVTPLSTQAETPWVVPAVNACAIAAAPHAAHPIRACWVDLQRDYHAQALKKSSRSFNLSERTVGAALIVSIAVYLLALVYELVFGGLLPTPLRIENAEPMRTVIKLILGSISAATLFVSNYFGRLSLSRSVADHAKMERFYSSIGSHIDRLGQTETVLCRLAREELIENSNWCACQRDNGLHFSL